MRGREHFFDYCNPAFQALFPGRPLAGHLYAEALPETVAAGLLPELDQVYATGQPYHGTALPLVSTPPGSGAPPERYYNFSYDPYREKGRIVGIAVFAHDVTEQVLARCERETRRQELQRTFEQAPVAITVLRGPAHTVELANPAICAIWGRPPGQVLGRPYFAAVPDTAGQGFEELFADVLRAGEPVFIDEAPVTLDRAHTYRPPQGHFNFVFQSLLDEQQPVGIVAIGIEVTDQVRAREQVQMLYEELAIINEELRATNEELHESNSRLSHTNADLDTFVHSASHDLKSPIANIEGLLLALRQQLPPAALEAELVPRLLSMMDGAVGRFQQTLGHLTDVSRLPQALLDQPAETVDLPALVEAVRLDMLPELTATGATLTLDLAACPTLHFPAKNLRSILYNLLSNAIKYRSPARPARISLGCYLAAPGQVTLAVQDNGPGLTDAQRGELFQLFRRLHSHVEGSGVGLYMVKKMVDNAGGTLTVESAPGIGSTFSVTLPVGTDQGAERT
ncbi:MAG: ATP-binding protein [Hymenobacter sp.]